MSKPVHVFRLVWIHETEEGRAEIMMSYADHDADEAVRNVGLFLPDYFALRRCEIITRDADVPPGRVWQPEPRNGSE